MSNSMPLLLTKKDLSERRKIINRHYESINNPKFSEMKDLLDNYHLEIEKGIRENLKVENENFKKHFFSSLENLLNQVAMIKNDKTKTERIDDIFVWYNKRIQFFKDLSSINARTSKNIYEKYPEIDKNKKSNYYEAGEYPLFFESKHRTEDDGLLPPKDRLKEFKRKTLLDTNNNNANDAMNKTTYNITNVAFTSYNNVSNKELNSSAFKNSTLNQSQNIKKKEQDLDIMNLRVSSAASSNCFRSTHYTMNSTGTKFFNSQNLTNNKNSTLNNNFNNLNTNLSSSLNFNSTNYNNNQDQIASNFHPTREIKSSYSTFRPRYDYSNLVIEKSNLAAKQKDLAEKRNQEEMKEMLNEWGISRARYVEEVEKKHETQTLLKFYEKNLSNLNSLKNLNSDGGTLNSLANKNLSNLSSPRKEAHNTKMPFDSPDKDLNHNNYFNNNNNNNENEIPNQIFLQSPERNKNKNIIDINENPLLKEEISLMRLESKEKGEIAEASAEAQKENIMPKKDHSKSKNLIRTRATKIKNLLPNSNKLSCNKDEKRIEIKFKEDAGNEKAKKIIKQMKSTLEKIPTDKVVLMKAHDKVFEARHTYSTLLNVKEIDNYKDGYKYHVTPLSLYDNLNLDNFKDKQFSAPEESKAAENKRPSTGFEFLRSRYNNNPDTENFLNQRKNLTNFNRDNAFKSSEKVRNLSYNLERVKSAFNPPVDDKVYPKYFLPTPGFGLVVRVVDPNAKKKKKRGKSSKKKK